MSEQYRAATELRRGWEVRYLHFGETDSTVPREVTWSEVSATRVHDSGIMEIDFKDGTHEAVAAAQEVYCRPPAEELGHS